MRHVSTTRGSVGVPGLRTGQHVAHGGRSAFECKGLNRSLIRISRINKLWLQYDY